MAYMTRNPGRRARPQEILPEAESVICLGIYYYPGEPAEPDPQTPHGAISRYAWGKDYHQVIENLLDELVAYLKNQTGPSLKFKAMVDHGPALEKALAQRAGLGLSEEHAADPSTSRLWIFLAELITNLKLERISRSLINAEAANSISACLPGAASAFRPRCPSVHLLPRSSLKRHSQCVRRWRTGCSVATCVGGVPYNTELKTTGHSYFMPSEGVGP
jgi:epoxyqueuosine reductase